MTSKNTKRFEDVRPGEALPELAVPITVTLINGGAIATRDYFPVTTTLRRPVPWVRPMCS